MNDDMRKNGKGMTGKPTPQFKGMEGMRTSQFNGTAGRRRLQFKGPRNDWGVPVTTGKVKEIDEIVTTQLPTTSPNTEDGDIATVEIPAIDKIVTRRLQAINDMATMQLPAIDVPQLSLSMELRAVHFPLPVVPPEIEGDLADAPTWVMPAITKSGKLASAPTAAPQEQVKEEGKKKTASGGYLSLALEMLKNSGIYAVSAMMSPLVSLILSPYLTRTLSTNDYGALAGLYTIIDLISTITQLGLSSAFFRAYNKDYETPRDRAGVIANTILLLALCTIPVAIGIVFLAPVLSRTFLGATRYSGPVAFTAIIIVAENLALPASSWFRAEKRPIPFTILSVVGTLGTLILSIVLVGFLHMGVTGALIAKGIGYVITITFTYPLMFFRLVAQKGLSLRLDIMKSMLTFSIPSVFGDIASWILQVSDSWLLILIGGGLTASGEYRAAYVLGGVLSPVLLAPWGLAWGPIMYSLSKRDDAPRIYQLVFRWWSSVLLMGAFGLSLVSIVVLDTFYAPSYRVAEPIIPLITLSTMLQGVWYMFMIGVNLRRKTILEFVYMLIASGSNLIFNLFLIPRYGQIGAAASTLLSYILLAAVSCTVNQRIYPINFEVGSFSLKLIIGVTLYLVGEYLIHGRTVLQSWYILLPILLLYGVILLALNGMTPKKIVGAAGFVQTALLGKGLKKSSA